MGTGGRCCRAPGLQGCGDAEIRAFGNLGLGARLRVCRTTEMDIWMQVCRRAWLWDCRDTELGRHEVTGHRGMLGWRAVGSKAAGLLSGEAEGLRSGSAGLRDCVLGWERCGMGR